MSMDHPHTKKFQTLKVGSDCIIEEAKKENPSPFLLKLEPVQKRASTPKEGERQKIKPWLGESSVGVSEHQNSPRVLESTSLSNPHTDTQGLIGIEILFL